MRAKFLRLFQPSNPDKPLGGRYKVISQLGAGGFGQTFLAEDLHLPGFPRCVVKQLKPQVSDAESLQTARRLFDTEARVLYQLGNHDQIPRLLAHFEDNREFYLAQELVEGEPLTQELVMGQPWSEAQVMALLQDLLNVLTFVHQQQVIHRDIKPSNLMRRRRDGKIVLIDFGAVKQVSTQLLNPKTGQTNLTISIGTQGYMPKEQLGGNPRFSSDVYAVGIIGIQALTGVHPRFLTENSQTGEIDWREHTKQVSPELAAFLDQMVRYDFRSRYLTATEALTALRSLSVPSLPQPLSESPGGSPSPELLPPSPAAEPRNMESATPDIPSTAPQPVVSGTKQTEAVGQFPRSPQLSGSSAPTVLTPDATQRQFRKSWSILAILATVGATLLLGKTLLSTQPASQISARQSVPVKGSAVQPGVSSTENPESLAPGSPSPSPVTENPASPTPATSAVVSSSPSPASENPASPAPATSGVASPPPNPVVRQPAPPVSAPAPAPQASAAPAPQASPVPAQPAPSAEAPSRVAELLSRANNLRQGQKYQQALNVYDKIIASQSDVAEAHWGRCYSLNSLQRTGEALAACEQALAINPNYPEALWSKGSALEQQQRYPEALKLYERATELKPDFAEAWNNRGTVLYHLNRSAEAVAAYQEAIDHKPDFSDAWANRGAALWDLRRFDEARASVNKALEIQPNHQNALNLRQQMQ